MSKHIKVVHFFILAFSFIFNACNSEVNHSQQATEVQPKPTPLIEWLNIPFEICAESKDWTRPSEEKQNQEWWSNGRYAGVDEKIIKYYWEHNFLIDYGNADDAFDNINLSGLWTDAAKLSECLANDDNTRVLVNGDKSRIWLLYYKALSVAKSGQNIKVEVKPTNQGYQIILIPRGTKKPFTFTFVDSNGKEIDAIIEGIAPFAYPWTTEN